jgi:hypothetical protein
LRTKPALLNKKTISWVHKRLRTMSS